MTCKNRPRYDLNVFDGTLNLAHSLIDWPTFARRTGVRQPYYVKQVLFYLRQVTTGWAKKLHHFHSSLSEHIIKTKSDISNAAVT